ncbi:PREDICTED: uncharacterized protein K02A2.6-like [Wasmannia auropunctata]|uniref:uncharacterized protein K02A2.6-like n=1 Tax=Wasmannia auropunctata TaxID=64793 RepID=UPI0005F0A3DF|nr:PREDICTED: uncharacterized protein K02A2.6-like [Wasmannia auropunctata]
MTEFYAKRKANCERRSSDPGQVHQVRNTDASSKSERKFVTTRINDAKIKLQLDCGSDATIISQDNWKKLGSPKLKPSDVQLTSASGHSIHIWGAFDCCIKLNDHEALGTCHVSSRINLLGNNFFQPLGLWDVPISSLVCNKIVTNSEHDIVAEVKRKFPQLFSDGLGKCTKTKISLTLKQGAKPVFRKARLVPFAAAPVIAAEIERLRHLGVISPVDFSTSAAPIVAVKKSNGKTRICGDYSTGLNDILEPNQQVTLRRQLTLRRNKEDY